VGRHKKSNPAYRDSRPRNRCDRDYYHHSALGVGIDEIMESCRSYALKCLRIAQNASSSPEKLALLEMAQGGLRKKLQSDGERIQNDIARYAELSQQVMQLTTIISDNVKKLDVSL
jgi:hypothetical protein